MQKPLTPPPFPLAALAVATAVLLAACPQPSSRVSLGGHELDPESGVFWSGVQGSTSSTRVVIADQKHLCDRYEEADGCTAAAQAATPGEGTFLTLTVSGQAIGDYEVAGEDANRQAEAAFVVRTESGASFSETAVGGLVTFTTLSPGEGVAGRYTLTMSSGGTIDGTFGAEACANLDRLVQLIAQLQPACTSTFVPTSCSSSCTCGTRNNSAECSRADSASPWSCTCLIAKERTKCTVPKSEANVCTQGNGCCDTSF